MVDLRERGYTMLVVSVSKLSGEDVRRILVLVLLIYEPYCLELYVRCIVIGIGFRKLRSGRDPE